MCFPCQGERFYGFRGPVTAAIGLNTRQPCVGVERMLDGDMGKREREVYR